jgi:Periplasmic binding protein
VRIINRLAIALLGPALALSGMLVTSGSAVAASATPGVTSNSITIGVTYVDLAAVAQFIHGLNQGNYQAVYQALINNINAHGGLNGRTLKAIYEPINPVGSTSASSACTQLTEDDHVFAVVGFLQNNDPQCYVSLHATPVIGGTMTTQLLAGAKSPWFSTTPIENQIEPETLAAAAKDGVFKGKKVAVFSQSDAPAGLVSADIRALKAHGITPVATADVTADANDVEATLQQIAGVVTQKFQSAGANVVVTVGNAGQTWPNATTSGTYHPEMVAGSDVALTAYTATADPKSPALANAVTGSTEPLSVGSKAVGWSDPAMQKCVHVVEAAGQKVPSPVHNTAGASQQFFSVVQACQNLTILSAIVNKAGKTLTDQTFAQAGDSLGTVHVPALGTGAFSKATPAGSFPLYLYRWDANEGQLVPDPKPVGTT